MQIEDERETLEPKKIYRERIWAKCGREWATLTREERKEYEFKATLENSDRALIGDPLLQFVQDLEEDPEICASSPFGLMDNEFALGEAVFEDCINKFNSAPHECSFTKHHAKLWRQQHGEVIGVDPAHIAEDIDLDEPSVP